MTDGTTTDATVQTRKSPRALRVPQVLDRTKLSKTHLYRLIQQGKFPRPHKLSERVSAWDEAAVDFWLAERFGL